MAAPAPSSSYCPSFPVTFAAAAWPRPRRGRSLRQAAAGGRHSSTTVKWRDAALQPRSAAVDRRCDCFDLHQQIVPFAESQAWQESIVARRKGLAGRGEDHSDTLIVLQHPPVFTLGNGTTEECLHFDEEDPPFEVHRVDRAGKATYHGPGQASRVDGLTGVWVEDQKVASIGIHVVFPRHITCQGVALNVTTDLPPFEMIVPWGIKGCRMGSIKEILQKASDGRGIDETSLMDQAYNSLIKEFAEVFKLSLDHIHSPNWRLQQSNGFN
ncbi:hypothetical protein GQ55_3G457800 [Panicum hallii var. hallii]|uniref:BPL/LPL catalytic domain-containing protein n=1 Tax=Panicum hallii var. hallii TaxID=1504633 RepID=A0A2T7EIS1_9POAL|nr:hypothetical protein GQ55_3G457800 [Panicum hallii var. hallii]